MTVILSYLGFTTVVEVGRVHLRDFRHGARKVPYFMLTLICESIFKYVHICRFVCIYIHTYNESRKETIWEGGRPVRWGRKD